MPRRGRGVDALVILGILVSLGLIGVSAVVNFRMGYRMADTELDGWVYGIGAALVDCLKAFLPFVGWWAWRRRDWISAGTALATFILFSLYSVSAGMGFAAQHRAFRESEKLGAIEQRDNLRRQLQRAEATAAKLGPQRSEAEVGQEIEAVFARPVAKNSTLGGLSQRCTLARRITRDACEEVAKLRAELARARQRADVDLEIKQTQLSLTELGSTAANRQGDPQVETLRGILGWGHGTVAAEDVRLGLVLLVGLLFEAGSGLGLFLVTTPWRLGSEEGEGGMGEARPERLGSVEDFAVARLEPANGGDVSITQIYAWYVSWCSDQGAAPLRMAEFFFGMEGLAGDVGIPITHRGANVRYRNVRLRGPSDDGTVSTEPGTTATL